MARHPRLTGFDPEIIKRLSENLLVVRVGVSTKIWAVAFMRMVVPCGVCRRTIEKKKPAWREITQTSLYRRKRVCLQCWPQEEVKECPTP